MKIVLAGDIGGTNTRLVLAKLNHSIYDILAEKTYPSSQYANLQQVIEQFLSDFVINDTIAAACFAVAGPVENDTVKLTNLPWLIQKDELAREIRIPFIKLINDFMAVAHGISLLNDNDILVIQKGKKKNKTGNHPDAAVIGAGTGLGVSHRVWINDSYRIFPSESGHSNFAPGNSQQARLLDWLLLNNHYVSTEMILSGKGIYTIYRYLNECESYTESITVKSTIGENDPARIITEFALARKDALCIKTVEIFTEIYGAVAGNVALQYYPVDELYIAGGIAPRISKLMQSKLFIDNFTNKGLMASNMEKIKVNLVLNDKVGLYGAISSLLE